jgi:hypothetical protein
VVEQKHHERDDGTASCDEFIVSTTIDGWSIRSGLTGCNTRFPRFGGVVRVINSIVVGLLLGKELTTKDELHRKLVASRNRLPSLASSSRMGTLPNLEVHSSSWDTVACIMGKFMRFFPLSS